MAGFEVIAEVNDHERGDEPPKYVVHGLNVFRVDPHSLLFQHAGEIRLPRERDGSDDRERK